MHNKLLQANKLFIKFPTIHHLADPTMCCTRMVDISFPCIWRVPDVG